MERRPSLAENYQGRGSWQSFSAPGLGTRSSGEIVKSVFWRPLLGELWNYRSGLWGGLSSILLPRPTPTQSCPPCFSVSSLSGSQEPAPPPFRGRSDFWTFQRWFCVSALGSSPSWAGALGALSIWRPVLGGGRLQWRLSEAWSLPRALLGAATEAKTAVLLVLALLDVVLKSGAADSRKETPLDAGLLGPEQSVSNGWKSFFLWPPRGCWATPLALRCVLTLQPVRKNPSA
uniref:Uncharacterized protein n=1 Tax=Gorilla gorilla gorilla TaxID=9595 RepID=A0A2I2ZHE3_GORGO